MTQHTISKSDQLPKWYHLKNYKVFEGLTLTQWFDQISARRNLNFYLDMAEKDNVSLDNYLPYIEANTELNTLPLMDTKMDWFAQWGLRDDRLDSINASDYVYVKAIHSMTARELVEIELTIDEKLYQSVKACVVDEKKWNNGEIEPDDVRLSWNKDGDLPVDILKKTPSNFAALMINLDLEDSDLVKFFESELTRIRRLVGCQQSNQYKNPIKFSPEEFIEFGLIPYLDLKLWERIANVKITKNILAHNIFPSGTGGVDKLKYLENTWKDARTSKAFLTRLASLAAEEKATSLDKMNSMERAMKLSNKVT